MPAAVVQCGCQAALYPAGYDDFLNTFKLPIGVWSLSIPLVAIVAHMHRTLQTASQLDITRRKNTSDSFFSHHKYITEALAKFPTYVLPGHTGNIEKKITDPYKLYNNLFENASYETGVDFNDTAEKLQEIQDGLRTITAALSAIRTGSPSPFEIASGYIQVRTTLNDINRMCTLSRVIKSTNFLYLFKDRHMKTAIITPYQNEDELKQELRFSVDLVSSIFGLMNKQLVIDDLLFFYMQSSNPRHYYFASLFENTVETDEAEQFRHASSTSPAYHDEEDEHYFTRLKHR